MAKYKDVKAVGRSQVVPFVPGEDYKTRHMRRLRVALENIDQLRKHGEPRGWRIRLLNANSLIEVRVGGDLFEWWPGTAKAIVNKKYNRGIHCHDHEQFIKIIERKLHGN